MGIIFYNLVSITIGVLLIYYGIRTLIKTKKILFCVLTFIHAALFIGFGILGFFVPEGYEPITVLAMLAFTITMILCVLLLNKKEPEEKVTKAHPKKVNPKDTIKEEIENNDDIK